MLVAIEIRDATTRTTVQTNSVPIPGIFSTHEIAMKPGLSTSVTDTSGAMANQDGFIRLCGEPNGGSTLAAGWIGEINTIWAKGASNTLQLARIVFRARRTMRYGV